MTLEDLKKLTLPVKLVCFNAMFQGTYSEITVTTFNSKCLLITNKRGIDDFLCITFLEHFKPVPRTEIVERDCWFNVYGDSICGNHYSKEIADKCAATNRLLCKHIKIKCEIDSDTKEFIREVK